MRNDMEIERVPIAQLKPYPKTLRIHNRKKRRKLASLLRRFGQAVPVLIDEAYQIIAGQYLDADGKFSPDVPAFMPGIYFALRDNGSLLAGILAAAGLGVSYLLKQK